MGKLKRMDQVKEILKTYLVTKSLKATARQLRISKNTVKEYGVVTGVEGEELGIVIHCVYQRNHATRITPNRATCITLNRASHISSNHATKYC